MHRQLIRTSLDSQIQAVLDCGCGTGIYAHCFEPQNYTGVDISPAYIERCRQRCPQHQFHVMDATKLEFGDGAFGAAMISGVLHHLNDDDAHRVCEEVHRVLKPGGKLLIWEDIPTLSRWNWIGAIVHRLDLGEYIRVPDKYQEILAEHFTIQSRQLLRSGVMDYVALVCSKAQTQALGEQTHAAVAVNSRVLGTDRLVADAGADRS